MSNNEHEGKGFSGLSGITTGKPSQRPAAPYMEQNPSAAPDNPRTAQPRPVGATQTQSPPLAVSQTKSSAGARVLVGLAVLAIGGYWVSTLGESSQQRSRSYSPSSSTDGVAGPSADVSNEDMPPVGAELVLSTRQIRYCVFEKIRLDGAEGAVNQYESESVDRFNSMVNDFNSRCGSFRYRDGSLAPVEREGLALQDALRALGRSRVLGAGSSAMAAADAAAASGDAAAADAAQAAADTAAAAADAAAAAADAVSSQISASRNSGEYYSDAAAAAADAAAAAADAAEDSENEAVDAVEVRESSASVDPENLRMCLSGNYPLSCKHELLSPTERVQVAEAERRANFRTCSSGNYPLSCKHELLSPTERVQVAEAERRVNLRTCLSGSYPLSCKHELLSPTERVQVAEAESRH